MKTHLLLFTSALALSACAGNPHQEHAPETGQAPVATVAADAAAADVTAQVDATAQAVASPQAAAGVTQGLADDATMRLGREATALLFEGRIDTLFLRFDAEIQAAVVSADNFRQMAEQIFNQIGAEMNVVDERVLRPEEQPGVSVYRRRGHYLGINQNADLFVAFNADSTIAGINIRPAED